MAQTVEKLVLEAIEEADNALKAENSTLRAEIARINDRVAAEPWLNEIAKAIAPYEEQIKKLGFTEVQAVDQLSEWQMALAGPDKVRAFRALMHSHGVRPEDVTPETQARVTARRSTTV